jgi:hypothetical protein
MKTRARSLGSLVAGAFLLLAGCNTVYTTHTQEIGGPEFPPSDPAKVEILRKEPTRPHIRLGEVRAEPSNEEVDARKIEEAIRKEAAKIGADAAVVIYDHTQITGEVVSGPWVGRTITPIEDRVIIAVAIKYQ